MKTRNNRIHSHCSGS